MTSSPTKKQVETAFNLALFPQKFIEATALLRKFYEKECRDLGRECPTRGHLIWYDALMASVDSISNKMEDHIDEEALNSLRFAVISMLLLLDAYVLDGDNINKLFTTYLAGEDDETTDD